MPARVVARAIARLACGGGRGLLALGVLGALLLAACGGEAPSQGAARTARSRPEVWTSFYPTTWMVTRIAGDLVDVRCPLPPDEDPKLWQPSDEVLSGYQQADLVVLNGAGFERWADTASLPVARRVDSARPLAAGLLQHAGGAVHSHGSGPAHVHEGVDPHTWLDPQRARQQAGAIHAGLLRLLPQHEAALAQGLARLESDLQGLEAALRALGPQPAGQWLYASHPAYNYLAQRMGWRVENLDLDPGALPSDAEVAALREALARHPGKVLLWESEPLPAAAERLERELGLASVVVEPCEAPRAGDGPDGYLERWRANVARLAPAFAR
ncbi:MAG: metal ABC transporter substrate-binding protein [Planctomycetia bacterium]